MDIQDINKVWEDYDRKLEEVLTFNRELTIEIKKGSLERTFRSLQWPKGRMIVLGIPYTFLMLFITFITFQAKAYLMMLGFGIISLIMIITIIAYCYQLVLIGKLSRMDDVASVQKELAKLKITSYKISKVTVL